MDINNKYNETISDAEGPDALDRKGRPLKKLSYTPINPSLRPNKHVEYRCELSNLLFSSLKAHKVGCTSCRDLKI